MDPGQLMSHSAPELCSTCGGMLFRQAVIFRRVSKFILGTPQDQLIPIPVFRCDDCGTPIKDMMPQDDDSSSEPEEDDSKIFKLT